MTPPGIDPGTSRIVAQCLNHYATPGPLCGIYGRQSGAGTCFSQNISVYPVSVNPSTSSAYYHHFVGLVNFSVFKNTLQKSKILLDTVSVYVPFCGLFYKRYLRLGTCLSCSLRTYQYVCVLCVSCCVVLCCASSDNIALLK